ncbi:MAG: hypothetical protein ABUL62_26750 [Myxococcales bacterium]|jgi:hypothetical protein
MKRTLQCAFAAAALLASSSAWAQDFGKKGQLAVSAERLFGFTYSSSSASLQGGDDDVSTTGFSLLTAAPTANGPGVWAGYGSPRVAGDYFVIDHLSVGAALGYAHVSVTDQPPGLGNNEVTTSGHVFTFAPRAGYSIAFNDMIGIWPRAGFTYRSYSVENLSAHNLALTLEAPFTFNVFPHVVFWGGPTLDLGFTGSASRDNGNGTTTSNDLHSTEFGIQTALLVYFDL